MPQSSRLQELLALMRQRTLRVRRPLSSAVRRGGGTSPILWYPGGMAAGEMSEWVSSGEGSGTATLALSTLRGELPTASRWLMIDVPTETDAPALVPQGIDLSRVVFVSARKSTEALWAAEQGLRSGGVDVVCCRIPKLASLAFRRLKLAAETGESRCLLLRGTEALRETSWAETRWLVTPLPSRSWRQRRFQVKALKIKNGVLGGTVSVEVNDETGAVRLVSELADSTDQRHATGA